LYDEPAAGKLFLIRWHVGGPNCDKNQESRDAIVILDSQRTLVGTPWFKNGLTQLCAVKAMIGTQAPKGMQLLAKFVPNIKTCGVWEDGGSMTAIEAYPAACKDSESQSAFRRAIASWTCGDADDRADDLTCALLAMFYATEGATLRSP